MSKSIYTPGYYVKNGVTRVANSPAQAVALQFDGYKLASDEPQVEESAPETEEPDTDETPVEVAEVDKAPKPTPPPSRTDNDKD